MSTYLALDAYRFGLILTPAVLPFPCFSSMIHAAATIYTLPISVPASTDFTVSEYGHTVSSYGAHARYAAASDTFVNMQDVNAPAYLRATLGNFDFSGGTASVIGKAHCAFKPAASWTILLCSYDSNGHI